MRQVSLIRPVIVSAVSLIAVTSAAAAQTDHLATYDNVVIEHAELVRSAEGSDRVYLTIYNGSQSAVALTNVEISGYGTPILVSSLRNDQTQRDKITLREAFITIPHQAELDMSSRTLFLTFSKSAQPLTNAEITVTFFDGLSQVVPLRILSSDEQIRNHHHGAPERE